MEIAFKNQSAGKKKFHLPKKLSFLKNFHSTFYYFWFLVIIGIFFFAVSLFFNYFTTPFTGDYTAQQYAFYTNGYDDWWSFFRTGKFILYDTNTYLGASNIGSNSFYYLFDPFFLPILIFPRDWIPQMMAIMTIFKMAFAGLIFHYYMKYMGVSKRTARLTGLAYAFCGWTTWYLWFNHFTGVALIFPVVLLGVEKVLREKRPWVLMFSLLVLGFTNFFFFFTFTVCAFLYAIWRYFQRLKENDAIENLKILGIGFIGFFAGCLLACMVVIPAMMVSLNAPRANSTTYINDIINAFKSGNFTQAFNYIFSWESVGDYGYKVYYPVLDFIFPVMSDRGTPLTRLGNESYDNVAGSLFCFSPIIIFLVPALIYSFKKNKISHIVATGLFLLMLFTPFCYYAFHGFTYAYSRWTLFVTTSLITYVGLYFDHVQDEPKWTIFAGAAFALIMVWLAALLAIKMTKDYPNSFELRYSYENIGGKYGFLMIECAIASVYIIILSTIAYVYFKKPVFNKMFFVAVSLEAVVMGALTLYGHGFEDFMKVNNGYSNNKVFQEVIDQVNTNDKSYFRAYSSQEDSNARNDSMRHNYNGVGMFHSVYNYNDYAFLNWSQINDYTAPECYSGSYVEKRQNLDTFLGIKYYFVNKERAFWGDETAQALKSPNYRVNAPVGFKDITSEYPNSTYYVYEDQNHIDFAFSFDRVAYFKDRNDEGKEEIAANLLDYTFQSEELYLKTALIGESDLKHLSGIIPNEKIAPVNNYRSELTVSKVNTGAYEKVYYDIHGDDSSKWVDPSSWDFASKLLSLEGNYPKLTDKPADSSLNGRYVTVITPNYSAGFPYDKNGLVLYLKNSYLDSQDINVYLTTIDEDGVERFLTFDNHSDSGFDINGTYRKNYRGFYTDVTYDQEDNKIDAPKINKIIIVSRKTSVHNYQLFYDLGTNVNNRIAEIKKENIQNVNYSTNHFDFTSNFTSPRIVVTQLPYEDGWTVKATDKTGKTQELDVFKSQGGFVSFATTEGEFKYSMDFYTPYLQMGGYLSAIGLFISLGSYFAYLLARQYNERKESIDSFSLNVIFRDFPSKLNLFF